MRTRARTAITDGRSVVSPQDVVSWAAERGVKPGHAAYIRYHAPRYAYLLGLVADLLGRGPAAEASFLDVGPGYQTELLCLRFPNTVVNTLGFEHPGVKSTPQGRHYDFDLNLAYDETRWPDLPAHDVVVMAEVIEHLTTSPVALYRGLARAIRPGGHLVVQTPNAAALAKRLRLLTGRPPGSHLDVVTRPDNPTHFREFFPVELERLGSATGLHPVRTDIANYLRRDGALARTYSRATSMLPKGFREGLTVVYRREA